MASDSPDAYASLRGDRNSRPSILRSALIVVDMQNGFCHDDGSFARIGADIGGLKGAIPGCVALVRAARAGGVPVIFVYTDWRSDYLDGGIIFNEINRPVMQAGALVRRSWDAEIVAELTPKPEDFLVPKLRFSAFYATQLEGILSSLHIEEVVICGVTTNICVESTARDAAQRNFRTFVVADATAEIDPAKHDHALETLGYAFCRVVHTGDVLEAWSPR